LDPEGDPDKEVIVETDIARSTISLIAH